MKLSLVLSLFLFTILSYGQTVPSKARAIKDFELKKESIEKQLKFLGIESGLKDIKVEHTSGPYRKYSIGSITYYYDYVTEKDAAYHNFTLTTPTYPNGDKFVLNVVINYDSYLYTNNRYRKSLGEYALRSAKVSVKSYEGKELTHSLLLEKLNDLSIKDGTKFEVASKYHFTSVEEVTFEKTGELNYRETVLTLYDIKLKGQIALFESNNGNDYREYEILELADAEAFFTARIGLEDGKWEFVDYFFKPDRSKDKITNIQKDPDVPAYIPLRYSSLKEIMTGPHSSDEIPKTSIKYMNDVKNLVLTRLNSVPKKDFIKGELLTSLFSTNEGQSALNQFYGLKKTMSDYYLDSVSVGFNSNRTRISTKDGGQFSITYSVIRTPSKELYKKAKSNGASKAQLAIIKYPAKGYYNLTMRISIIDGKVVITEVIDPSLANRIEYINGGGKAHPMSILE